MKNFKASKDKNSVIEFEDGTHFICLEENWEDVAGYIEKWVSELNKNTKQPVDN